MAREGAVLVAAPQERAGGCQIEFKPWFQHTKPVSGGLTPRSPHPQGPLAELPQRNWPQKGLAVGCEVAGREVLMIHNTRRRGGKGEGAVEEKKGGGVGGRKKDLLPGLLPGDG